MIVPVILAGGSGTRLWPLSRERYPKQLINVINEKTMLQETLIRISGLEDVGNPIVICNDNHRFMVAEQLREIEITAESIFLEPVGRNTAPALAIAALRILSQGLNPLLLVLPADHIIKDVSAFHDALSSGESFAKAGYLVTFGIVPEIAETGYGYIRKGDQLSGPGNSEVVKIAEFVEKPDKKNAEAYVKSGRYCWNSGMFMFKASQVIKALKKYTPEIVEACERALNLGKEDLDFFRLDADAFETCPSESIDYALMEKTDKGAMVSLKAGWDDLGSWAALWKVGAKNQNGNVIQGDVLTHDVKNSYLKATHRMIAAVGLENHIVIETSDAVLISPLGRVQEVKKLVDQLKSDKRSEASVHRKVYRPWGVSEGIDMSSRFQVQRITVRPGRILSLQKHFHRAEHWIVVKGTAMVTKGEDTFLLKEDESTYIPLGETHRLQNPGTIDLELIEVQSGSYLGEDDIVRFEDVYGR
ncbi:MAG: mannose-1-phosphate guanylyltransferase/mannose-6-phosphate isomerase [Desulfobacteraceae bacterium]|jgi:mannose-1-phosphate guanylyltransferase/mannose-1-phosphate guanylyltransferase/mannose-6-phosphate isomerase|nr:mannose-1-phosphate guanylyltransferase/mannose-6-phosphate isomerase [Desulfobacteraceae bacterium]